MKNLSTYNELIAKYTKLRDLAIELKNSTMYENSDYVINLIKDGNLRRFILFDIKTEKEVAYGTPKRIYSYLERRKINPEKVYGYNLLSEKY